MRNDDVFTTWVFFFLGLVSGDNWGRAVQVPIVLLCFTLGSSFHRASFFSYILQPAEPPACRARAFPLGQLGLLWRWCTCGTWRAFPRGGGCARKKPCSEMNVFKSLSSRPKFLKLL